MAGFDVLTQGITPVPDLVEVGLPPPDTVGLGYLAGILAGTANWNRTWVVSIAGASPGPPLPPFNSLRTVFDIEKTPYPLANKAKIQLYNLSDLSRARYFKGNLISLAVGYSVPIPVFTNGAIRRVSHERKGPDIITTFECAEGERELRNSVCNLAYPAGTNVATVVAQMILLMGLVQGPTIGLLPLVYSSGVVFAGKCSDILTKLLKTQNLTWSVQNGFFVQIAPPGTPTNPTPILVTAGTGLIGAPNLGLGGGGDNVLTFTSLIRPGLVPGAIVSVVSRFLTMGGTLKTVKLDGDTHGSKWTAKCECVPVSPA